MSSRCLILNMSKMESIIFLPILSPPSYFLYYCKGQHHLPVPQAHNLEVILNPSLSLTSLLLIQAVAKACWISLCSISGICPLLFSDTATTLVQALIISHLDCSNSLVMSLPASSLSSLQSTFHSATKAVFLKCRSDHVSLSSLHPH